MVIGGANGAIPRTATTRPSRGSSQQQVTQQVEAVSQARLGTTKTGKPHHCIQWGEKFEIIIICKETLQLENTVFTCNKILSK
jgi:hypothetical protein